jgi:glycosyltransferase A (GT-A) superfamily protein (DUF2064 family)
VRTLGIFAQAPIPGRVKTRLVAGSGYRTIVWFTPPTEGAFVVIGTDTPGIDRRRVTDAFTALGGADLVLGPTTKGGV